MKENLTPEKLREKKGKKQKTCTSLAMMVYMMAFGGFSGYMLAEVEEQWFGNSTMAGGVFYVVICTFAMFAFFWLLHVFFHELGHMIFGLISGYEFQSIRFGKLIILKTDNGIKLGKYSLSGTGGQCLMKPPKGAMDDYPTALYNLGGCIVNGVLTLCMLLGWWLLGRKSVLALFCFMGALIGLGMVLLNGIPISALSNDGYNTLILQKSKKARRAFRFQLEIVNGLAKGYSTAQMPQEWFAWELSVPENNLETAQGINKFSYLLLEQEYKKALEVGQYLWENAIYMTDIHSKVLKSELLFCNMMLDSDRGKIKEEYKKEEKNFRQLNAMLSMQRTNYAYALLVERDEKKAKIFLEKFQGLAQKYPYPGEVAAERELMSAAEEKYQNSLLQEKESSI